MPIITNLPMPIPVPPPMAEDEDDIPTYRADYRFVPYVIELDENGCIRWPIRYSHQPSFWSARAMTPFQGDFRNP